MSLEVTPSGRRRWQNALLLTLTVVWLCALAVASAAVWRYKSTPGATPDAPSRWPEGSSVQRDANRATLVVLAHPLCPCTRATMTELQKLAARLRDKAALRVVFLKPDGTDASWEKSGLIETARSILGAEVLIDRGGVETARFGGRSSGYTLLYDRTGELMFAGGITIARGHEGDSAGSRRIESLVNHQIADGSTAPVFGCSLVDPSACQDKEHVR